jgi:hypothetical protein
MNARVHYQLDHHWSGALGVDTLNNSKYLLFHSFPQRTFHAELKYDPRRSRGSRSNASLIRRKKCNIVHKYP